MGTPTGDPLPGRSDWRDRPGREPEPGEPTWPPRRSGTAIAALVFGVLAIPLALTIYPGVLAGLVALILGLVGLVTTRHGRATGRGMAVAGLITGLVGLVFAVSLLAYGLKTYRDCEDRIGHRPTADELRECSRTS
jgi:hypothetical protein